MKEKINEPIYTLTGIVIHGRGIGKHVGTPTANIEIAKNTFLPKGSRFIVNAPTAAKSRRLKNRCPKSIGFSFRKSIVFDVLLLYHSVQAMIASYR